MHFVRPLLVVFWLYALALAAPADVGSRNLACRDDLDADATVGEGLIPLQCLSVVL